MKISNKQSYIYKLSYRESLVCEVQFGPPDGSSETTILVIFKLKYSFYAVSFLCGLECSLKVQDH